MRIRCERCATLYRLDPALLPREGAPVQCTRCGHVFPARPEAAPAAPPAPPRNPGRLPEVEPATTAANPAARSGARPAAPPPRPAVPPESAPATTAANPAARSGARPAAPPRRPAVPPESAPAASAETPPDAPPPSPEAVAAADAASVDLDLDLPPGWDETAVDDGGAGFDDPDDPVLAAFHRRMARRRKIVLGAVAGLAGVAVVAVLGTVLVKQFGGPSHDPAAVEKADRILAAIRTGDPARALAAAPLGEEALALAPDYLRARADRGLALLVASLERKDLADRLAAKRPPIERALRTAEEAGDEEAAEARRKELAALKEEYDPVLAAYSKLKADADAAIEGAYRAEGGDGDAAAVRAMGMLRAVGGDEKNAPILAANYRKLAGDADGWADLVEGQLLAAGRAAPEKRARAAELLAAALEKDPELSFARLLLGKVRLDLDDLAGARQHLDRALAAAPENVLAKRWRDDVERAVTAAAQAAPPAGGREAPSVPDAASTAAAPPATPPSAG